MSFAEVIIVLLVGVLCLKPSDIGFIVKQLRQITTLFNNVKREALSMLDPEGDNSLDEIGEDNIELMNYYLERIVKLDGDYNGEYNIKALKSRYQQISNEASSALKANSLKEGEVTISR